MIPLLWLGAGTCDKVPLLQLVGSPCAMVPLVQSCGGSYGGTIATGNL